MHRSVLFVGAALLAGCSCAGAPVGEECKSSTDCRAGLLCDPVTRTCQPTDAGPGDLSDATMSFSDAAPGTDATPAPGTDAAPPPGTDATPPPPGSDAAPPPPGSDASSGCTVYLLCPDGTTCCASDPACTCGVTGTDGGPPLATDAAPGTDGGSGGACSSTGVCPDGTPCCGAMCCASGLTCCDGPLGGGPYTCVTSPAMCPIG
jgi:hypothetical protein